LVNLVSCPLVINWAVLSRRSYLSTALVLEHPTDCKLDWLFIGCGQIIGMQTRISGNLRPLPPNPLRLLGIYDLFCSPIFLSQDHPFIIHPSATSRVFERLPKCPNCRPQWFCLEQRFWRWLAPSSYLPIITSYPTAFPSTLEVGISLHDISEVGDRRLTG
jgi:hypothetical protein